MGKNALYDIIRNDSCTLSASVTEPVQRGNVPTPISINGWSATLTVKNVLNTTSNENDDSSALLQVEQTNIEDPNGLGVVTFVLTPDQMNILPGAWVYDVQFEDTYGNVYSSDEDTFIVTGDVTRSFNDIQG